MVSFPKHIDYHAAFRNNGRICLREHHDLIDHNAVRLILINKFDNAVPFEIPGEFVLEYAVMLRRQSYCQLDLFNGAVLGEWRVILNTWRILG